MSRDTKGRPTAPYGGGEAPLRRRWAGRRIATQVARVALAIIVGGLGGAVLYILLEGF